MDRFFYGNTKSAGASQCIFGAFLKITRDEKRDGIKRYTQKSLKINTSIGHVSFYLYSKHFSKFQQSFIKFFFKLIKSIWHSLHEKPKKIQHFSDI